MRLKSCLNRLALAVGCALALTQSVVAADNAPAYKVFGKVVKVDTLRQKEQDKFYRIDSEKFQLIDSMAKDDYLEAYWTKLGKEKGLTADKARQQYLEQHVKFTDAEMRETLAKFKDHPKLKELPVKEQEDQIRQFLRAKGESEIMQAIIDNGLKTKELEVLYERTEEPVYKLAVTKDDVVRYGPLVTDTQPKPKGCKGDDCAITIIEYSEFQCPFCSRVLPTTKQLLEKYEGKIRWIVRDFPLNFHPRARPAAIAAKCAGFQGRYWDMYTMLFENQQNLGDQEFESYAKKITETYKAKPASERFDKAKYDQCMANPKEAERIIDANLGTAQAHGVTGTPSFFVNGRRMSGALAVEEFEEKIAQSVKK